MLTSSTATSRHLPESNPSGWFSVGFSHEFKRGEVHTRKFFDGEVVVYRTEKGLLRVSDPYCPHMGAHFGREVGSRENH